MSAWSFWPCAWALVGFGLSSTARGQVYEKLLDFEDHVRVGGNEYDWLWGHTFDGDTGYFVVRGTETEITPNWESQITKVEDAGGTPTTTLLVSNAQWEAFVPRTDPADNILPGSRMAVLDGEYLQFLDVRTDAIYRVHITTGEPFLFVSNAAIRAHTGLTSARLIEASAISSDGKMAFYDQDSDSILTAEVNSNGDLTTNGTVTTLVTDAELDEIYNYDPINNVSGGMTFDSEGNLYWTTSQFSNTGPQSGSVYKRDASDGTLSPVLSELDIQFALSYFGSILFNDIYAAPDGNIYFFEAGSHTIVYFHPDDPVNTLAIFLTEAEAQGGPAGPAEVKIRQLSSFGTKLVWSYRVKFLDLYAKTLAGTLGDCDPDGDVDLYDFACFQECFGTGAPLSDVCGRMDMDQDTSVDLDDYDLFVPLLGGPGN